jgi:hypothetical protein
MRWVGHVAYMKMWSSAYRILVGKPKEKRPPGRPRHIWDDNIKIDLQEVGGRGMDWIDSAQDRWQALVYKLMNLQIPCNAWNFLAKWETVSFSRRTLLHGVSE